MSPIKLVSKTFHTKDGYKFRLNADTSLWTDGDLSFAGDPDTGWPVDANGELIPGSRVVVESYHPQ